jgi:putative alpha-1,2-mannosidase
MKAGRFIVASLLLSLSLATAAPPQPVDNVDVFMGTSNSRWMIFPGPTLPFGLVKLSPDNQGNVWNGGYEYTISSISGFSHLHAMGLSGLSLMPMVGPVQNKPFPGPADGSVGGMWTAGYRSRFRKEDERGSPGYYRVCLLDAKVDAELTATGRCGMMRLTYPESDDAHLILDFDAPAEERTQILGVEVRRNSPQVQLASVTQCVCLFATPAAVLSAILSAVVSTKAEASCEDGSGQGSADARRLAAPAQAGTKLGLQRFEESCSPKTVRCSRRARTAAASCGLFCVPVPFVLFVPSVPSVFTRPTR